MSAGDVEGRLGPGAFRLGWGFPHWLQKTGTGIGRSSLDNASARGLGVTATPTKQPNYLASLSASNAQDTGTPKSADYGENQEQDPDPTPALDLSDSRTMTLTVLSHVLETFTTPSLLDTLPLSAAGNPSAWHAWRSYRGLSQSDTRGRSPASSPSQNASDRDRSRESPRHPGDWNWDGVFESRVRNCIHESISESTLFGAAQSTAGGGFGNIAPARIGAMTAGSGAGGGQIRFEKLDREKLEEVRREVREGMVSV